MELPSADTIDQALAEIYESGVLIDIDGNPRSIEPVAVTRQQGAGLRDLVVSEGVRCSLETGFGLGLSAAHIAAGLVRVHGGEPARHIAIDPTTRDSLGFAGWALMQRLGLTGIVELVEEESQVALPRLMSEGLRVDLAYIDGDHRFDPAFVDLYFAARIVRPGGLIVVDDMWMPALRGVVAFFVKNLDAELIADAFPGSFGWTRRRPFSSGPPPGQGDPAVLRMPNDPIDRPWDHFVPF